MAPFARGAESSDPGLFADLVLICMSYLSEFRGGARYLTAASFGLAAGYGVTHYVMNLQIPNLMAEFGWSRAELAMIGLAAVLAVVCQPIAGRLTDVLGVRRIAVVGVIAAPLCFIAMSRMTGSLQQFLLICVIQVILVGGTTSATIYSRLIAQNFDRARGICLAIAACAPAVLGGLSVPLLARHIDAHGWRSGYVVAAAVVFVIGAIALLLIPRGTRAVATTTRARNSRAAYREVFSHPAFLPIIIAMLLCNISFTLQTTQLKVLLLDKGFGSELGSTMISLFAGGVVAGRLLCGIALDKLPTHIVSAIAIGLPALGLGLLATDVTSIVVVGLSVVLLGLCIGGEGDVIAYVVMKYFKLDVYSTVLGIVLGSIALSITLGSLLLGFLVSWTGSYAAFLFLSAGCALVAAFILLSLGKIPAATRDEQAATADAA